MILYSLKCAAGHGFEAWLPGSEAYEAQRNAGQIACAVCGSSEVEKDLMAPSIGAGRGGADRGKVAQGALTAPASPAEAALREMRRKIETEADYVGPRFAEEARRIHEGEATERAIWGEASASDAKSLREEGIPVTPIPWLKRRDA